MFSSVQEVKDGLRESGYIADSVAIATVFLASSLHRPVFSEGPAGSGKTQLAYAVAQAANTGVERLQCYEGIGEDKSQPLQRLIELPDCLRQSGGRKGVHIAVREEAVDASVS